MLDSRYPIKLGTLGNDIPHSFGITMSKVNIFSACHGAM